MLFLRELGARPAAPRLAPRARGLRPERGGAPRARRSGRPRRGHGRLRDGERPRARARRRARPRRHRLRPSPRADDAAAGARGPEPAAAGLRLSVQGSVGRGRRLLPPHGAPQRSSASAGRAALPDLRRYLDLVALGTVADVVPLREENRVLVAHGLRALDRTERPGLRALKEAALVDGRIGARDRLPARAAPERRRAPRRGTARGRGAHHRATRSRRERWRPSSRCDNAERRALEDAMVAEARSLVAEQARDDAARSLVVARRRLAPGRRRHRRGAPRRALPSAGGRHRARRATSAAARGAASRGVDLHGALTECADLLDAFGGHRQAVGLTVRRERVDELGRRVRGGRPAANASPPTSSRCSRSTPRSSLGARRRRRWPSARAPRAARPGQPGAGRCSRAA